MDARGGPGIGRPRTATRRLVTITLGAALAVTGCASQNERSGSGGRTLVVAQLGEARSTLDPALSADVVTYNVVRPVLETLVTLGGDGTEVVPLLATSWHASADGRSWTFRLRENVRFHDGTPFDADAVCANFERWYNFRGILQHRAFGWRELFGGFATADTPSTPADNLYRSCEARTAHEAVVTLNRKSGTLLPGLAVPAFSIASPTALRRYEADKVSGSAEDPRFEGAFGTRRLVGTGPFELQRWDRNDKVVLVRNRAYWGPKPSLDRVVVRRIDDGAARRQALETGEIHGYWPVSAGDIEPLRRAGFQVHELPGFTLGYLGFNQGRAPLDNPKIRQAIAYAIDREKVVRAKYAASATVANQIVPPNLWGHAVDARVYAHDPARARRLIAEAGVANPVLELWYPTGLGEGPPPLPDPEGIALSFKADLEEAGFTVVARPTTFFPDMIEALQSGRVQMFLGEVVGFRVDPDVLFGQLMRFYDIGAMGAPDAELLGVLDAAADEIDQARRAELYQQANRTVAERLPVLPFVHVKLSLVHSPRVTSYRPSPIFWEGLFALRLT